jgi:hypothetical protein
MADEQPDRFAVSEQFRFIGRTFTEYRWLFDLGLSDLAGQSVLDCAAGPASFTATASQTGADATAIDPAYGQPVESLGATCRDAVERTLAQLQEKTDLFVWERYGDVETRGRHLRSAYQRFLADYSQHPGRYISATLPDLPFDSDQFDLALSANLLFLYDDRLDLDFHLDSLRELARVADEVRIFPLASLDAERSEYVDSVVDQLETEDYSTEFQTVPYEFQPGVTEMLIVSDRV